MKTPPMGPLGSDAFSAASDAYDAAFHAIEPHNTRANHRFSLVAAKRALYEASGQDWCAAAKIYDEVAAACTDPSDFKPYTVAELDAHATAIDALTACLSAPPNRELFNALLASVRTSPTVELVPATHELFDRGTELYASRSDKAWSLTDCISFIVMQRQNLTDALTTDRHFTQAGFNALLAQVEK